MLGFLGMTAVEVIRVEGTAFGPQAAEQAPARAAAQSQTHVSHNMKASHRIGVRKVVVRHDRGLHRGFLHSRHYGYDKGKKVVIKHTPTHRTLKTKAAS
jgi:hypothetical protein